MSSSMTSRSPPSVTSSWASAASGPRGEWPRGAHPAGLGQLGPWPGRHGPRRRSAANRPELQPEVDEPRRWKPPRRRDEVVEPFVDGHLGRIVAWSTGAGGLPLRPAPGSPYRSGCNGPSPGQGSGRRWTPTASSSLPSPCDLERDVEALVTRPPGRCHPSPCACSAIRETRRRPPRTRSSEPTEPWPDTTRRGSANCALAGVAGDDRAQPVPDPDRQARRGRSTAALAGRGATRGRWTRRSDAHEGPAAATDRSFSAAETRGPRSS